MLSGAVENESAAWLPTRSPLQPVPWAGLLLKTRALDGKTLLVLRIKVPDLNPCSRS